MYRKSSVCRALTLPLVVVALAAFAATTAVADGYWHTGFGTAGLSTAAPDDRVRDLWVDGTDLYVVGEFTMMGQVPADLVAKWDGTSWSSLAGVDFAAGGLGPPRVYTVTEYQGNLVVGGVFNLVNGNPGDLAVWDGASWSTIPGYPLIVAGNDYIFAMSAEGSDLYIAGGFTDAVVHWDGATMTPLIGSPLGTDVFTILAHNGDLFAGGVFTSIDGVTATNIARWDGTQWNATPPGFTSRVVDLFEHSGVAYLVTTGFNEESVYQWSGSQWTAVTTVQALGGACAIGAGYIFQGDIYRTGLTRNLGTGEDLFGIGRWYNGAWDDMVDGLSYAHSSCPYIDPMVEYNGRLLVGGEFTSAGGLPAINLTEWNGHGWHSRGLDDRVHALELIGTDVYASGDFQHGFETDTPRMARWDGLNWHPLGSGLNAPAVDLQTIGTDLFAAGEFTEAGGMSAVGVAKWDGALWSSIGSGPQFGSVKALATDGTNLYAAGDFLLMDGVVALRVAKWDGAAWSQLGGGILDGSVETLLWQGGTLYAGGTFVQTSGGFANNVAAWDGASWSDMNMGFDTTVRTLAVHDGMLFAGGDINNASGASALNHMAMWNGSQWEAVLDGGARGVNAPVEAMVSDGTELFVIGEFTTAGTIPATRIARWNGTGWATMGTGANDTVRDVVAGSEGVYFGGDFTYVESTISHKFARWTRTATAVTPSPALDMVAMLDAPYPNPFNPVTHIRYRVPVNGNVTLAVYAVNGRKVQTLVSGVHPAGTERTITWNGTDDSGTAVASGVYYAKMEAAGRTQSQKLVLLK